MGCQAQVSVSGLEWCLHHLYLQMSQALRLCVKTLRPLWVCFYNRKPLYHGLCGLGQGFRFHLLLQQLPFSSKQMYLAYGFHGAENSVLLTRGKGCKFNLQCISVVTSGLLCLCLNMLQGMETRS